MLERLSHAGRILNPPLRDAELVQLGRRLVRKQSVAPYDRLKLREIRTDVLERKELVIRQGS